MGIFVLAEITLEVSELQDMALVTYPMSSPRYVAFKLLLASFERRSLVFCSCLFEKEPRRVTGRNQGKALTS